MNRGWTVTTCALALAFGLTQTPGLRAQQAPAVPDAPTPQAPAPLSDFKGQVTPGSGTAAPKPDPAAPASSSSGASPDSQPVPPPVAPPTAPTASSNGLDDVQKDEPDSKLTPSIIAVTNFVEVPVTVKDSKGHLVAGLTFRDFRVFENNVRQSLRVFSVDPAPLSMTFVIDQSLTQDVMSKVNTSLRALQGALTPYDEVAVITYNNGAKEASGFTGAQSGRLTAVLEANKSRGRDEGVPVNSGPLAGCGITSNGACVDPNLQQGRSAGGAAFMQIPKEIHTLNDAILRAAQELSNRPKGRRRVIYVVSDGKDSGSKASTREVIKYLQQNKIAVYATLVGDSARWGEGYLSRFHIPFQMNDNVLPKYTQATGGSLDAENSTNGIEKSYQKISEEARYQYTLGYISHQPAIDGRFRSIDVRVDRPNVDVSAKLGYYPTAQDK